MVVVLFNDGTGNFNANSSLVLKVGNQQSANALADMNVSFRQACLNPPGRFGTLAALEWEDRDACEQSGTVAEGFVAGS